MTSPEPSKPKLRKQHLPYLVMLILVAELGTMVVSPIQPEIALALGVTITDMSFALSLYFLPSIFLTPIFGALSDKFGRLTIIIPSMILFGISGLGIFLVVDFTSFVILRLFQAIANAGFIAMGAVIAGDLYKGQQLKSAMGVITAAGGIGMIIGLNIGSFLSVLGWQIPFLFFTVTIPVALVCIYGLRDVEVRQKEEIPSIRTPEGSIRKLKLRDFLGIGLVLVFVGTFYQPFQNASAFLTYLPFLLISIGVEKTLKGAFMTVMWLGTLVSGLVFGALTKKTNIKNLLALSYFICAIGLFLFGIVNDQYSLMGSLFFYGLGFGITGASIKTLLLQLCPPNAKGTFVSLQSGMRSIGRTGGPATFAFLALINPLFTNLTPIYWTIALMATTAGIVALLLPQSKLNPCDQKFQYVEKDNPK
ncbi:MAG: MFS transporter [Candidatus Ranarchaeia archaeon]|jgi:MFS family permease